MSKMKLCIVIFKNKNARTCSAIHPPLNDCYQCINIFKCEQYLRKILNPFIVGYCTGNIYTVCHYTV